MYLRYNRKTGEFKFGEDDPDAEWTVFSMSSITYGQKTSSAILKAVVYKILQENEEPGSVLHTVAERIYVDDGTLASKNNEEREKYKKEIERRFLKYGFTLHEWECNPGMELKLNNNPTADEILYFKMCSKVFGHRTLKDSDLIVIENKLNLNTKIRGFWTGGYLPIQATFSQVVDYINQTGGLTPRKCLQVSHSMWNINGMMLALETTAKLMYRRLVLSAGEDINWDSKLTQEQHMEWAHVLHSISSLDGFAYFRNIIPRRGMIRTKLFPMLATVADGNIECCAGRLFLISKPKYPKDKNKMFVSHIAGKSKIAALSTSTAPRSELQALLVCTQLITNFIEYGCIKPASYLLITDSEVSIQQAQSGSAYFEVFVSNLIKKIQANINPKQIYHVPRVYNGSADSCTRIGIGYSLKHLKEEMRTFFQLADYTTWPITTPRKASGKTPGVQNSFKDLDALLPAEFGFNEAETLHSINTSNYTKELAKKQPTQQDNDNADYQQENLNCIALKESKELSRLKHEMHQSQLHLKAMRNDALTRPAQFNATNYLMNDSRYTNENQLKEIFWLNRNDMKNKDNLDTNKLIDFSACLMLTTHTYITTNMRIGGNTLTHMYQINYC